MTSRSCPRCFAFFCAAVMLLAPLSLASAADQQHLDQASQSLERGIAYLRQIQAEDGSWSTRGGPGITALCTQVLLDDPNTPSDDPAVKKAIDFILTNVHEDGSIHGGMLQTYNTAICLSTLSRVSDRPELAQVIKNAQNFLKSVQWNDTMTDPKGDKVDAKHPWYGGVGYGPGSRPDMSNLFYMLQAFQDSGVDCNDPSVKRAVAFVSRLQGIEQNDTLNDTQVVMDGAVIYSSPADVGQKRPRHEQGGQEPKGPLRGYGTMTYAAFKSYIYAQLDKNDPRVVAAKKWLLDNWTVDANPGLPAEQSDNGLFYYFVTMSKALNANGECPLKTADGKEIDWQNNLIAKLASIQQEDGSWQGSKRWHEDSKDLATAYACIALQAAQGE